MDSSRPVDRINHRRADHQLACTPTVPAISELCCRSQPDHVHRQAWRAGPANDDSGWSKVCSDRIVYEASLAIALGTRRTRARFILISELTSITGYDRLQEAGECIRDFASIGKTLDHYYLLSQMLIPRCRGPTEIDR